ncbi:MAG: SMC family ATPase [Clostridiales bacterium]|nr:SMC family ATPase [Clostridiales bacterium]
MRPLALYLRNFKSYGENAPILDFEQFDIALLSGENGNGKSSLADAIAWCVWGKCKGMDGRGGIDDLVRTGAEDMEVSFTFEEDGNVYKVIRKRDKRRGQSALDFMLKRGDAFVPISGNRIDETQLKIQEVIKLDYETYLCTGYLSQGKADLFAMKKPNERKEILAEILNLSVYDRLERKALDKRNELRLRLEWLEREMENLQRQLAEKGDVEKEMARVIKTLADVQDRERALREQLAEFTRRKQEKESIKERVENYQDALKRGNKEINSLIKEEADIRRRLEDYRKIIEREDEIENSYAELRELQKQEKALNDKFQRVAELMRKKERLEGEMRIREQNMIHRINVLEKEMEQQQEKMSKERELKQEWERCQKKLQELDMLEKDLTGMEERAGQLTQEAAGLIARRESLNQHLRELGERYKVLKEAQADCPVCGKPLDDQHKKQLMDEAVRQGEAVRQAIKETGEALNKLDKQKKEMEARQKEIRFRLKERGKLEGRAALLFRQIQEAQEAKQKHGELNEQLVPLRQLFNQKAFVEDLIKELEGLEGRILEIGYDAERHRIIQERIVKLNSVPNEWEALQKAKAGMVSGTESLVRFSKMIDEKRKYLEDVAGIICDLQEAIKDLPDILERISELEGIIQDVQREIRRKEAERGALGERMEKIREAETLLEKKRAELGELQKKLEIYNTLALIYGKRGIQAAIIENAIPELQDEANRILAKITDGRLAVEFLTQRDTKAGSVVETLDIKISDGMDTRKYETYSGGEEFRINFAIRIALAKILANRAGANMRMLILDEGFGVLDEQGRERLVEVINAIRDEFDKILVITHVQELKDSFPVQIEVVKTPAGSTFKIVG